MIRRTTLLYTLCLVVILASCDILEDDHIEVIRHKSPTITAQADETTLIDIHSLFGVNEKATFKIVRTTQLGQLEILSERGLLQYSPQSVAVDTTDTFVYSLTQDQTLLLTDTAHIDIVSQIGDSCAFRAMADEYYVTADSTIYLDVTNNDALCDSIAALEIIQSPQLGSATVNGRVITYSPSATEGTDELIYTIYKAEDNATSSALVTLHLEPPCSAEDVTVYNDTFYISDSLNTFTIPVLSNDHYCGDYQLTILQNGLYGTATVSGKYLEYTYSEVPHTDSLIYQLCIEEIYCDTGQVGIRIQ